MHRSSLRASLCIVSALLITTASAQADEFRCFWADAWGYGFRSLSEVEALLGKPGDPDSVGEIRKNNLNAVIVQVRRRFDTCYPSGVGEPYMSGLTPADFNSLQAMIDAAHDTTGGKKRIEVHAWIVTFKTAKGEVFDDHSDPANPDNYWPTRVSSRTGTESEVFDPGHPKVLKYLADTCMDLVTRFDIDGLHYDYIRFDAANQGFNPTSLDRYRVRHNLSSDPIYTDDLFEQWRRDQVSAVVRQIYARIQAAKPTALQSGSFVTWNPSPTSSTYNAFKATRPYYDVFSDWDSWIMEGIVDMAVPMTYYDWAALPTDYTRWMNYEKDFTARQPNRHMYIGPGTYHNNLNNAIYELQLTRTASPAGNYADGYSGYCYKEPYYITWDPTTYGSWANFAPRLKADVNPTWEDIPARPWKVSPSTGHIMGTVSYASTGAWADHAQVTLTGTEDRGPVYVDGTGFYTFIDLSPGNYTITATKSGYTSAVATANVTVGAVTGNMYVRDLQLGGGGPRFSDVASSNVTGTGASITWNTNTAADSKVEYGTSLSYGSSSPLDATLVTSHTVNLSGLTSNTLYHYRIVSSNAGGSTYSADYTFMTKAAPEISLVRVENISCDSATIAWMTFPGGTSQVDYGLTSGYGNQTPLDSNLVTTHYVTLTGLTHSTQYHYRVTSGNDVGTDASSDLVFTTLAPPVLSNVQAIAITSTGATITWTTDLPSSSQVSYGLTAGYGSQTPLDSALVTSHTVLITGLQPNTPYHYAAVSGNCAGTTQATDRTFTTLAPPPVISDVQAGNITNSTATITWNTDVAATSQVEYGTTTSYGQTTALDSNMVTSHSVNLTGLSIGTLYHYRVISSAAGGPSTSGDFTFTTDSNMSIPVVSNVESGNWGAVTSSNLNVRITWTTDIPADSFVEYGLTTSYDMSSEVEPEMVTSHSITLSPLNPNTLYHYRVRSGNGIGGYGYSDDATFRSPIVIDNVDSGCTKTGTWSTGSQSAVPKVGSNYQYTPNSGNPAAPPTATCRWTANLTLSGFYDVYVGYQIGGNRTLAAPYTIAYIGGQTAATAISQNGPSNTFAWTRVGTNLPFAAGTGGYVEVGNNSTDTSTSRLVSADAAMFLYVGSDTTPPTVPAGVQAAAVSTNSIQLTWAASTDDFLVAGYKIYRDGVYVGSSATTTYTDTDLTPNTSYSYEIAAYDGVPLESARSAPLGFVLFVFDTSGDGKLNEADLTDFLPCAAAGANVAYPIGGGIDCSRFNTDADVDVDVDDFGVFQRCMNGTAGINLTCLE